MNGLFGTIMYGQANIRTISILRFLKAMILGKSFMQEWNEPRNNVVGSFIWDYHDDSLLQ